MSVINPHGALDRPVLLNVDPSTGALQPAE
jgi:hypothetical protein